MAYNTYNIRCCYNRYVMTYRTHCHPVRWKTWKSSWGRSLKFPLPSWLCVSIYVYHIFHTLQLDYCLDSVLKAITGKLYEHTTNYKVWRLVWQFCLPVCLSVMLMYCGNMAKHIVFARNCPHIVAWQHYPMVMLMHDDADKDIICQWRHKPTSSTTTNDICSCCVCREFGLYTVSGKKSNPLDNVW